MYIGGAVREVNARRLGKRRQLMRGRGSMFEINEPLFAGYPLVNSEDKLCILMSEFGTV